MSYVDMQYTGPEWNNQTPPPLNATNLLDICHALEAVNITQEQRTTLEAGTNDALGTILAALKSGIDSDVSSINSTLNSKGNCNIETGSYTGNGQYGEDYPNTISFLNDNASIVIISGSSYYSGDRYAQLMITMRGNAYGMVLVSTSAGPSQPQSCYVRVTFNQNSIQWYYGGNNAGLDPAYFQLNRDRTKYSWCALS